MQTLLGFLSICLLLSAYILWRRWNAPPLDIGPLMQRLATEGIEIAQRKYGVTLDSSIESIRQADEVLGKLHDELEQSGETGTGKTVDQLGMVFGAYVGECIRRDNPGSKWDLHHPVNGKYTYPLHWGGGESFPCVWCYKRLTNGEEDNVWHKYEVLVVTRRAQGGEGDRSSGNGAP